MARKGKIEKRKRSSEECALTALQCKAKLFKKELDKTESTWVAEEELLAAFADETINLVDSNRL